MKPQFSKAAIRRYEGVVYPKFQIAGNVLTFEHSRNSVWVTYFVMLEIFTKVEHQSLFFLIAKSIVLHVMDVNDKAIAFF